MTPHWKQPSHPNVLEVVEQPGSFTTFSRAKKSLPPGALVARLSPELTLSQSAYSSVQVAADQHVELNSDFLYINHSCNPSLEFHIIKLDEHEKRNGSLNGNHTAVPYAIEVRVAARKDSSGTKIGLKEGEELTFFYPSTEWDMSQPFECRCKEVTCRGLITGAKSMGRKQLEGLFLNQHIRQLLEKTPSDGR